MRDEHATTAASFDRLYGRADPAYGTAPTPMLRRALDETGISGTALDLGCGAGRDTIALARHGLRVRAIDLSARGVERLRERADAERLAGRIEARVGDVGSLDWSRERYNVVVAVTLLDHLDEADRRGVWDAMCRSLDEPGLLYVEVHTTDDPGSAVGGGRRSAAPVSESAEHVVYYYRPDELRRLAARRLTVLGYEERTEWDRTHGRPHQHGKASLLACPPSCRRRFADVLCGRDR